MLLPRSLGGAELAPADFVRVIEAIAKADASTAWCLAQAGGCAIVRRLSRPRPHARFSGRATRCSPGARPTAAAARAQVDGGFA